MPRLINPGMGDRCDRYTILLLKLRHKGPHEGWAREIKTLEGTCRSAPPLELARLAQVNALLWQEEDRLRAFRNDPEPHHELYWKEIIQCAFSIQALNDERARLVDEINQLAGDTGYGNEKG